MPSFLDDCAPVLSRTPATLDALLRGLPEPWTTATEGPDTWSPHAVVAHLIHCEKTNWMPRVASILEDGSGAPLPAFDRNGHLRGGLEEPLPVLLDTFAALRRDSLERLRALELDDAQLELRGTHPAFGEVTLRQLLATWTGHDLTHLAQVVRVMAKRYKHEVGPWAQYLSVMSA